MGAPAMLNRDDSHTGFMATRFFTDVEWQKIADQVATDLTKGGAFTAQEAAKIADAMIETVQENGWLATEPLYTKLHARQFNKALARNIAEVMSQAFA